jgi:single-strand selective monofunctional uracil DNA glycosylase
VLSVFVVEVLSASDSLIKAADQLRNDVGRLRFGAPVEYIYNPLEYAWAPHQLYLRRYGNGSKRALFLGMNPGPFGMVQTGIPFGQIAAVRDWLKIEAMVGRPAKEHPKRLVTGFACSRSEVSGERLWGMFAKRFGTAERFFEGHFVANYCPLAFLEASGRNRTPDKLSIRERTALFSRCDEHLRRVVETLQPEWLIGVGDFAAARIEQVFAGKGLQSGKILHPSPACPASNVDWAGKATAQLKKLGVW